jgi:hypothetical protein
MAQYVITYDLQTPGKDYRKLQAALEGKLNATRILLSVWLSNRTGTTATAIRDYLLQFIDTNDRLLVIDIEKDWASYNVLDINKL